MGFVFHVWWFSFSRYELTCIESPATSSNFSESERGRDLGAVIAAAVRSHESVVSGGLSIYVYTHRTRATQTHAIGSPNPSSCPASTLLVLCCHEGVTQSVQVMYLSAGDGHFQARCRIWGRACVSVATHFISWRGLLTFLAGGSVFSKSWHGDAATTAHFSEVGGYSSLNVERESALRPETESNADDEYLCPVIRKRATENPPTSE